MNSVSTSAPLTQRHRARSRKPLSPAQLEPAVVQLFDRRTLLQTLYNLKRAVHLKVAVHYRGELHLPARLCHHGVLKLDQSLSDTMTRITTGLRLSTKKPNRSDCPHREKKLFSCPMCALVCSSCFILQEHVELHLEEQRSAEGAESGLSSPAVTSSSTPSSSSSSCVSGERRFECPMCSVVCTDSFSLQEHVELHLDHGAEAVWSGRQRGLPQTDGEDHGEGRVVSALCEYYQTEGRDVTHVWLSADTDHYCSSAGDKGWGCGYRNFQMLLSSLLQTDTYLTCLQDKAVPSIPRVQGLIEEAWRAGLDPQGASHFDRRLQGTRAWIGATEIYSVLTSLGISSKCSEVKLLSRPSEIWSARTNHRLPRPTGPGDTHPRLFDWVKQYFSQSSRSGRLPPRLVQTSLPPLYLQHQDAAPFTSQQDSECDRSQSLCRRPGAEEERDPVPPGSGSRLLTVGHQEAPEQRHRLRRRHIRKFPGGLKHKQYQVVSVQGVLTAEEKQRRILNSRTLCAERIP
ncbi:hypothetical protein INR49_002639 [Caranx melampygus]|nr:hypothetical protein INR49_002639 [Caranx melampygus]